jgi:bifunctional UDP-N-acetylglucosamine pyrophosphorylase / glucosamine-1-phosphate N-acetyltransferase
MYSNNDPIFASQSQRLHKAKQLVAVGVTITDPEHTYIEPAVKVGAGTAILPGTHLCGDTVIGSRCTIGPDCYIEDSKIEDDCTVRYSVIEKALVRRGTTIGPYAHLRPKADVGPEARIGNFVEVKASRIRLGAKVGHLSYIGDADVGEYSNIGAGTITCNYDGKHKHHTKIGKHAFIGSNTSLVAPVNIGSDAVIGAGSTITEDVPDGNLALGRARQANKQRKDQREGKAQ